MKNQVKVNITQPYSEHIVHKGKLILIDTNSNVESNCIHLSTPTSERTVKPIIISETEDIEVGDWVFDELHNQIGLCNSEEQELHYNDVNKRFHKILALPAHFSENHIQDIGYGKMRDRDKFYLKLEKCDYKSYRSSCGGDGWLSKDHGQASETCPKCGGAGYFVELDQQNHITLFPTTESYECKDGEMVINLLNGSEYRFEKGHHAEQLHFPKRLWLSEAPLEKENEDSDETIYYEDGSSISYGGPSYVETDEYGNTM